MELRSALTNERTKLRLMESCQINVMDWNLTARIIHPSGRDMKHWYQLYWRSFEIDPSSIRISPNSLEVCWKLACRWSDGNYAR